jgi:hypothetical protein
MSADSERWSLGSCAVPQSAPFDPPCAVLQDDLWIHALPRPRSFLPLSCKGRDECSRRGVACGCRSTHCGQARIKPAWGLLLCIHDGKHYTLIGDPAKVQMMVAMSPEVRAGTKVSLTPDP